MGAVLNPPASGSLVGQQYYCYDTIGDSNAPLDPEEGSEFILYTKLENSGNWYWLDSLGSNGESAADHNQGNCDNDADDLCVW
jgi:hypothetical protein